MVFIVNKSLTKNHSRNKILRVVFKSICDNREKYFNILVQVPHTRLMVNGFRDSQWNRKYAFVCFLWIHTLAKPFNLLSNLCQRWDWNIIWTCVVNFVCFFLKFIRHPQKNISVRKFKMKSLYHNTLVVILKP